MGLRRLEIALSSVVNRPQVIGQYLISDSPDIQRAYVAEDGTTDYVAEDGTTYYVTES